ncbi:MAG: hypothetical protein PHF07_03050, partial [Candidatus Pacebacteria bacterium]|nr:hypothetical protein [Candidatus Paceibacterota bacterium]
DPGFGRRLRDLLRIYPEFNGNDVQLLKVGRHFWEDSAKIVVGREEKENDDIRGLARKGDVLIEMKDYPGPLTLVRNYSSGDVLKAVEKAKQFTREYSKKASPGAEFLIDKR